MEPVEAGFPSAPPQAAADYEFSLISAVGRQSLPKEVHWTGSTRPSPEDGDRSERVAQVREFNAAKVAQAPDAT